MVARRVNETDEAIERRIAEVPRSPADRGLITLTTAANHSVLWFVIAAALASRRGVTRRAAVRGVLAIGGASLITNAIAKPVMPRRRPAADALPNWRSLPNPPTSSSFPSGHAASATAFATAVAMESPLIGALIAPVAATVAYSRVHTGAHWTSDVVGGAVLGSAIAVATKRWWPVRRTTPARARHAADAPALPDGDGLVVAVNQNSGDQNVDPTEEIAAVLPKARTVRIETGEDVAERLDTELDASAQAAGVAGGDGSVAAAAAVAERRRLPLAVLPAGTLNHFARDIGVDSFDDTAASVQAGQAVSVDLATVRVDSGHPRPFLNTASIGGYPDLVRLRERWEHRLGKWLAGAVALVRVLAAAQPLHVVLDGEWAGDVWTEEPRRERALRATEQRRRKTSRLGQRARPSEERARAIGPRRISVWLLFVGNGPYHPRGMVPAWRPALDTGLLDIRYLRADLRLSRTRFVLAALSGALHRSRTYVQREAPALRVRVLGQPVALATDGEVPVTGTRFAFAVAKDRLTVYRPEEVG